MNLKTKTKYTICGFEICYLFAISFTQLFKNVFSPELDHTLAFIGFVQPASGGILTMAETQARWYAELMRKTTKLPRKLDMQKDIELDLVLHFTG